jgi:hypothetical protein
LWIDVTVPAAEHGLAAMAGSSSDVGVVGYTLGGGISWLSRVVVEAQVAGVQEALSPWSASHLTMNFSERPIDSRMLYPHANTYRRLQAIKAMYPQRSSWPISRSQPGRHDPVQSSDSAGTMTDPHDSRRAHGAATRARRGRAIPSRA